MKKYINISFFYLVLGLALGVFYREFSKINNFTGQTVLKSVHTHTLVLGFMFFMIVLILEKVFEIAKNKHFTKWLVVYNVALIYTLGTMIYRGILDVLGKDFSGLSHMAGLGHFLLGASLIWFVIILKKAVCKSEVKTA